MAALLVLHTLASGQGTIPAPSPNYAIYGSLSRQQTVYNNLCLQQSARQLQEYRKFQAEVRRQTYNTYETSYVYEQRPVIVRVQR